MIGLYLMCLRLVLSCGGQTGTSRVFLAVQLEAVVQHSAAFPQRHDLSLEAAIATISQRALWGTKFVFPSSCMAVPYPGFASRRALRARAQDFARVLLEKTSCPSKLGKL